MGSENDCNDTVSASRNTPRCLLCDASDGSAEPCRDDLGASFVVSGKTMDLRLLLRSFWLIMRASTGSWLRLRLIRRIICTPCESLSLSCVSCPC